MLPWPHRDTVSEDWNIQTWKKTPEDILIRLDGRIFPVRVQGMKRAVFERIRSGRCRADQDRNHNIKARPAALKTTLITRTCYHHRVDKKSSVLEKQKVLNAAS
jgi:uncharacterized lipoprotein